MVATPKKEDKTVRLTLELPHDFAQSVRDTIVDEIEIASKKWNVVLSLEEYRNVIDWSEKQLEQYVTTGTGAEWSLGSPLITVVIITETPGVQYCNAQKFMKLHQDSTLVVVRDRWNITTEPVKDAIPAIEFPNHVMEWIYSAARTAAFYGVGSYAE